MQALSNTLNEIPTQINQRTSCHHLVSVAHIWSLVAQTSHFKHFHNELGIVPIIARETRLVHGDGDLVAALLQVGSSDFDGVVVYVR